jgi:uncharacterized membrane protein YdbT with pleckstrin-like domain
MDDKKNLRSKLQQLMELDDDEQIVTEIRRHPIGLVAVYASGLFIAATILIGGVLFGLWLERQPDITSTSSIPFGTILAVVSAVVSAVVLFFTYVSAYIYKNNVIIVTNEKIVQLLYRNLVDRKISQLSLGDLEDVTVEQRGIFARIFKFGTLTIETAGEQNNYNFSYTPYPYDTAKHIVAAREQSIKMYGN